jgi:DNA-binding protein HU-beta
MTKAELINAVATKHKTMSKKATTEVMDTLFTTLAGAIRKNGRFTYPGFGTFTVRSRKARMGRNPQTGQQIKIKASKTVGFKPAMHFKKGL